MVRKSGVLLAITSLPSKYGIGCFSKEAYDFVDYLEAAGQHYWQVLPMGPTGYGDSPYQSFSTFAGNPYFIDLDLLKEQIKNKSSYELIQLLNDSHCFKEFLDIKKTKGMESKITFKLCGIIPVFYKKILEAKKVTKKQEENKIKKVFNHKVEFN